MFCSCKICTDKHVAGPSAIAELLVELTWGENKILLRLVRVSQFSFILRTGVLKQIGISQF